MTTTSIQFNSNDDLKKFICELKESIQSPWEFSTQYKELSNKIFLKYKPLLLCLFFTDDVNKTTRIGKVILGIFNSYIRIISVTVEKIGLDITNNTAVELNINNDYYEYLVYEFIKLVSKLHTFELVINKQLFIKRDLHQQVEDIRMSRPIALKDKKTNNVFILSNVEINKINKKSFVFVTPNNVALLLDISKKEMETAYNSFNDIIVNQTSNASKYEYKGKELSDLYDYFEHIQTSVIFSYTAVEALCNIALPNNYKYEETNNKGIKMIYDKIAIERNISTSEKLTKHLPKILNIPSPNKQDFWCRFTKLENIRNSLIHQKNGNENISKSAFQEDFLRKSIFDVVYSGFEMVEYICNANNKHSFFPLGISNSDINVEEVDDINNYFEIDEN